MNSIHIMSNSKEIPTLSIYGNLSAETSRAWDAPKPGSTPKYLMKSKAKKQLESQHGDNAYKAATTTPGNGFDGTKPAAC